MHCGMARHGKDLLNPASYPRERHVSTLGQISGISSHSRKGSGIKTMSSLDSNLLETSGDFFMLDLDTVKGVVI